MGRPIVQFPLARSMRRICADASYYQTRTIPATSPRRSSSFSDDPVQRARLGEAARARLLEVGLTWPQQVPILLRAVDHAVAIRGGSEFAPINVVATSPATETTLREQQEVASS